MLTKLHAYYKTLTQRTLSAKDAADCVVLESAANGETMVCLYDHANSRILGYAVSTVDEDNGQQVLVELCAEREWRSSVCELVSLKAYPSSVRVDLGIKLPIDWKPANEQKIIELLPQDAEKSYIWLNELMDKSARVVAERGIDPDSVFAECIEFYHGKHHSMTTESVTTAPIKDVKDKYLIVNDKASSIEFIIQDKSNIYGYAELLKKPNYNQVVNVAAESGWGPFLYDTVMSYLDKPVRPNRSLTSAAWNVWKYYFKNRPNVKKKELSSGTWDTVDLDNREVSADEIVEPVNYTYTIDDPNKRSFVSTWTHESEKFEDQMIERVPRWKDKRFNFAKRWFNMKYMN